MEKIKESIKEEILALSEIGYSNVKIARLHDVDEKSIRRIKLEYQAQKNNEDEILPTKSSSIADIKEKFAKKCEITLDRIVSGITDTDISKSSLRDKAISFGIFFDKMSLSKGLSTNNTSHAHNLVSSIRSSTAENQ